MWRFSRKEHRSLDDDIEEAVRFAAVQWLDFENSGVASENLMLRSKVGQFAKTFKPALKKNFKRLRAAPPELVLLIIAEGIALSGTLPRNLIEYKLGIRLPETPIAAADK